MASYCCLSSRDRGSSTALQSLPSSSVQGERRITKSKRKRREELPDSDRNIICISYRSRRSVLCCSAGQTVSMDSLQAPRICHSQGNSMNSGAPELDEIENVSSVNVSSFDVSAVSVVVEDPSIRDFSVFPESGQLARQQLAGNRVHSQLDLRHYLVPHLQSILAMPYYWGVMDRHEADHLLESKPEGTFLLRDSAQDNFLFSVSFRRYGRTLHARIENANHEFSFGSHDPLLFAAESVPALLEYYKTPEHCLFFEPLLTKPLPRTFTFSLQALARGIISSRCSYDNISLLPIPSSLKDYLRTYHYRKAVRIRHIVRHEDFDNLDENQSTLL